MKVFAIALTILGFVSPAAAQFGFQYDSPDLKSGKAHVSHVVLTPLTALVSQLDWKAGPYDRGKPMEAESRQLEKDLLPVVAATMRKLGFVVDDKLLSPESLAQNKELGDKVESVQEAYYTQKREIESHKKRYATEPISIGDGIAALQLPDDSDAIVILQATDYVETKGKKFSNGLPGAHSIGGWFLDIGIVDARTGTILYIARANGGDDIVKEPEKAGRWIEKSFKNFFKYSGGAGSPNEPKP